MANKPIRQPFNEETIDENNPLYEAIASGKFFASVLGKYEKYEEMQESDANQSLIQMLSNLQQKMKVSLSFREELCRGKHDSKITRELVNTYVKKIVDKEHELIEKIRGTYFSGDQRARDELLHEIEEWVDVQSFEAYREALARANEYQMKEERTAERTISSADLFWADVGNHFQIDTEKKAPYMGNIGNVQTNNYGYQASNPQNYQRTRRAERVVVPHVGAYTQNPYEQQFNHAVPQRDMHQHQSVHQQQEIRQQQVERQQSEASQQVEKMSSDARRPFGDESTIEVGYQAPTRCTSKEKLSKRIRAGVALAITLAGVAVAKHFFEERGMKEAEAKDMQPAITLEQDGVGTEKTDVEELVEEVTQVTQESGEIQENPGRDRDKQVTVKTNEKGIGREHFNLAYEGFWHLYRGIEPEKVDWIVGEIDNNTRTKSRENEDGYDYMLRYAGIMQSNYMKVIRNGANTPQEDVSELSAGMVYLANATFEYEVADALERYDPEKYGDLQPNDIDIQCDIETGIYKVIVKGEVLVESKARRGDFFAFDKGVFALAKMQYFTQSMEGYGELTTLTVPGYETALEQLGESLKCANAGNQKLHYSPETGFMYDIDFEIQQNIQEYSRILEERNAAMINEAHGKER